MGHAAVVIITTAKYRLVSVIFYNVMKLFNTDESGTTKSQ